MDIADDSKVSPSRKYAATYQNHDTKEKETIIFVLPIGIKNTNWHAKVYHWKYRPENSFLVTCEPYEDYEIIEEKLLDETEKVFEFPDEEDDDDSGIDELFEEDMDDEE